VSRIARRFAELKAEGRAGLVTFLTAGDPDLDSFEAALAGLPAAGADLIEIGMPFSDPMADGPAIQAAGLRALKAGTNLPKILDLVHRFRASDQTTPVVLMGYYNPIYRYGGARFAAAAATAGVDGLIIVDLPPEESDQLTGVTGAAGLDFIRLTTPTTDAKRLATVLNGASGFLYHVAIAGITGTRSADADEVRTMVASIRRQSDLPIAVGFGIRSPAQAAEIAAFADAAVVGTALVETVAAHPSGAGLAAALHAQIRALAQGVRAGRSAA
jgi:tryptophan synthase alpha chain